MKQANFQAVLRRYLRGESPPAEARLVEQWYQELNKLPPTELPPAEQARLKRVLWNRIQHQMPAPAPKPQVVRLRAASALRWAALVVFGLGLGWLMLLWRQPTPLAASRPVAQPVANRAASQWITRRNATSQALQLALADGSTVRLEPNSRLRYPKDFANNQRDVHLQGEAFFTVARNPAKPFRVLTDKVVTTVLGTSFTVRAYPGQRQALVKVRTGRVRVSPRRPEPARRLIAPTELIPNQQAVYSPEMLALRKELVDRPALLIPRPFTFDDRPVTEVIQALEYAYGVPIVYDAATLAGCSVRLIFKDEPLFEKLDLLCKTLGASYERAGAKIIFHSKGCRGKTQTAENEPATSQSS